MIRLIAAARTTLVVTAWLLGVPTMLLAVAGSPIPSRAPSTGQVQSWLQNPLDPAYKLETARAFAWITWIVITLAILAILAVQLRSARWQKVIGYLPPPAQSLAAAILGTAVVATSTSPLLTTPAAASTSSSDLQTHHHPLPASPGDHHPPATTPTAAHDARRASTTTAPPSHDQPTLPRQTAPATRRTWRVEPGDNLWNLAQQRLGNPHRWAEIYRINRGHLQANGYALTDPDTIDVGWLLTLPPPHPAPTPAKPPGTRRPSPPAPPAPSPPPGPRSPHTALPATTVTAGNPGDSRGVDAPRARVPGSTPASSTPAPPSSTARSSASTPPATSADRREPAPSAQPAVGVDVPGGWVTTGLAAGLMGAVAMVWRRRRLRYQPTAISSARLDEPDLLPPLAAMTRIRGSLRRTAPDTRDEPAGPAPTVREYQSATVKPELPPTGPSGSHLAGAADLPLSAGLGLTGDGALNAARGLLVATLAAGSPDDPDAKGRAIIAAATLTTLLGVPAADLGHLDRLTVTASPADAVTALEEEIIRRSRLLADAQAADVRTLRDTDVHAEPLPQLLLIAERPDPAWTHRLATAVRLGTSVDIGAVIIGDWPTGTTLTVDADGATGTDAQRLSILDAATAIDMLGLLREAHGDSDGPVTAGQPTPAEADLDPNDPAVLAPAEDAELDAQPETSPPASPTSDNGRPPVTVRVLGRPAVLDADGQPSPGIRSQAVELLVYLAVNRHGADLSDIMEALYPDASMRRASQRLSTVVADLRKHIRRAAATPTDTTETLRKRLEPIPNTGSRYHLDPAVVSVDWWTVLDEYEAVAATTDPGQQLGHLTAAIDATSGPLAEGAEYDWIDTDREAVRRHRIKLHVHAAALLADTDPHRSWLLLEQGCEIDPLSDELARTTMRAAAMLADADAIRHRLKTLREALDAHGLDISDDTEALARDLLRQLHPPTTSD